MRAAQGDVPSDTELERLASRLGPTFSAPVVARSAPWTLKQKLSLGLGIAGAVVLGALLLLRAPLKPAASTTAAPPHPAANTASAAPVLTAPPSELPSTAEPGPPPVSTNSAPANSPGSSNVSRAPSEAQLLERARRALLSDPARALALTRQHAARFPKGVLQQEREVIAIEALRRLGQSGAASQRADRFEQSYPDSAHRRGVEQAGRSSAPTRPTASGHAP